MTKAQGSVGWLLTAGAAAFAAYVLVHPHGTAREASTLEEATYSMAVEAAWVPSHLIGLAALVMIGSSVWMLLRCGWLRDVPRARRSAWLLVAGTLAATVEMLPHILVATETTALASGGPTPLTDLHILFQATLLPVYGLSVAALAFTGLGRVAHPVACVLGVIGGAALIVVGPLLVATGNPALGVIFMPGAGTFLFLLAAGARLVRGEVRQPALVGG